MARAPDRAEVGAATVDTAVVEARAVGRRFAERTALSGIDLRVGRDEIFGVLGPDGAGKTTLLQIPAAILDPSAGSCRVLGFDTVREAAAVNARIGYMSQGFTLYERLTVRETCLAPDIVEAILNGRQPKGLRLAEMLGNGPMGWEEQRRQLSGTAAMDRLAEARAPGRLRADHRHL